MAVSADGGLHITTKADVIGNIGGFEITNTFFTSILGSVILIVILLLFSRSVKKIPSKFQLVMESIFKGGYDYCLSVLEDEKVTKKVFPLVVTLFIFILFFNLIKFIPGTESLTYNGALLLKPIHTDLNMTLALSLVAFIFIQFMGIFVLGVFKYGSKFINLKKPASIPIGIIELISEIAKLVSLAFRLFGNVFVGGILILLVSHAQHFILPVPVMFFEIFVAILQASIFSMLTLFYVKIAISEPH